MKSIDKLKKLLSEDKVIPVVGAGVSYAAAKLPGWDGLIKNGLEFAQDKNLDSTPAYAEAKEFLSKNELTNAAEELKKVLTGNLYAEWLDEQFDNPPIFSEELIDSILRLCAPILFTTNYDRLIDRSTNLYNHDVFDWSEHELIQKSINKQKPFHLHLHGVYDKPETVILSTKDYKKLSRQAAYKSILENFWRSKHLLFIGCSRDGVLDNDFITVIHFFNKWFPDLAHSHYILLHKAEITNGTHVKLLQECNVTAIEYGDKYEALPSFLDSFNPNKEKAALRVKNLEERFLKEIQKLKSSEGLPELLKRILPEKQPLKSAEFRIINEVIENYNKQVATSRGKFISLQTHLRSSVDVSQLKEKIQSWNDFGHDPSQLDLNSFANLALSSYDLLEKIPKEFLEKVKAVRPGTIHSYYYDGGLRSYRQECYELLHGPRLPRLEKHLQQDRYFFENLTRIIKSLNGFLALNPDIVYAPLEPGFTAEQLPEQFIIVSTYKSISLLNISDLNKEIASVPLELDSRHLECRRFGNEIIVLGYNSQYYYSWNPLKEALVTTRFRVDLGDTIDDVFHYEEEGRLYTIIYCRHQRFILKDFNVIKEDRLVSNGDFFFLSSTKSMYRGRNIQPFDPPEGPVIYGYVDGGSSKVALQIEQLYEQAMHFEFFRKKLDEFNEMKMDESLMTHFLFRVKRIQNREVIVLRAYVGHTDTILFILEEHEQGLRFLKTLLCVNLENWDIDFFEVKEKLSAALCFHYNSRIQYHVKVIEDIKDFEEVRPEADLISAVTYKGDMLAIQCINNNRIISFQAVQGESDTRLFNLDLETNTLQTKEYSPDNRILNVLKVDTRAI